MQKKIFITLFVSSQLLGLTTVGRSTPFTSQKVAPEKTVVPNTKKRIIEKTDQELCNVHMPHMVTPPDRYQMTQEFAKKDIVDVFAEIYHSNYWLGDKSRSGQGSSLSSTELIRNELTALCDALKIDTILDIGCGDYYWMQTVDLKKRHYLGVDIVPEMIMKNREHFTDEQHHFLCLDSTKDPLPHADMIICRDVLAHLNYTDACNLLRNMKASGSQFVLMTTHLDTELNEEKHTGHHVPYDLTKSPFNLSHPIVLIEETTAEKETRAQRKAMGLWLLQDLDLNCLEH
jgi:SAM-dependent methyltransferase